MPDGFTGSRRRGAAVAVIAIHPIDIPCGAGDGGRSRGEEHRDEQQAADAKFTFHDVLRCEGGRNRADLYGAEVLSEWASRGGQAVLAKYGPDYFAELRKRRTGTGGRFGKRSEHIAVLVRCTSGARLLKQGAWAETALFAAAKMLAGAAANHRAPGAGATFKSDRIAHPALGYARTKGRNPCLQCWFPQDVGSVARRKRSARSARPARYGRRAGVWNATERRQSMAEHSANHIVLVVGWLCNGRGWYERRAGRGILA